MNVRRALAANQQCTKRMPHVIEFYFSNLYIANVHHDVWEGASQRTYMQLKRTAATKFDTIAHTYTHQNIPHLTIYVIPSELSFEG